MVALPAERGGILEFLNHYCSSNLPPQLSSAFYHICQHVWLENTVAVQSYKRMLHASTGSIPLCFLHLTRRVPPLAMMLVCGV